MKFIPALVSALIAVCGIVMNATAKKKAAVLATDPALETPPRAKKTGLILSVIGIWMLVGCVITLIFGKPAPEEFGVSIIPPRANFTILGYQPSETMLVGWGVMAVLITVAVILRIFFIPKLSSDSPGKLQNALEMIVETVENYTSERTSDLGRFMYGYIFAIGVTLLGNAVAELMGFRSPSSDLMFTAALSIFAFLMANWYGIRRFTVLGRIKSLAYPSPILLPIRLVTDLANPLSMACRLFGNTLSGMIIMNLLYSVLGNFAAGIPSVAGLYFNVFAALIQMVIFITLTLTNINEATTEADS